MRKATKLEFPVKYFEKNIIFAQDGTAWAYYEIIGFEYAFKSDEKKAGISKKLEALFAQLKVPYHLMAIPKTHNVDEVLELTKQELSGPLLGQSLDYLENVGPIVKANMTEEANDYHFYLGLQLPRIDEMELSFKSLKDSLYQFKNDFFSMMGMEQADINESEIVRLAALEKTYYEIIRGKVIARRINPNEYYWLIKRNFYRGIDLPPMPEAFKVPYAKVKDGRKPASLLHLSEGIMDIESDPRMINISQNINGDYKTGYTAFLVISYMPEYGLQNIDTEWIYAIQGLGFPVDVSIRVTPMDYREVMKFLGKRQKDYKDQEGHAHSNNSETSVAIGTSMELARDLEMETTASKMPQLKTTIQFAIYASTKEEVLTRVETLKSAYNENFKFIMEQPSSDQMKLFTEFIPGAPQYVTAYMQLIPPAGLAAGMFGATNQIGDNTGFPIGLSGGRPVYMNPKLYAQGKAGQKANSANMIFIGNAGFGKSQGMNEILYLSALINGAKILLIDPKGDRTYWKRDLIGLEDYTNVITLEATEENMGRLDPFNIIKNIKDAETSAFKICCYLLNVKPQAMMEEFTELRTVVEEVAFSEKPCMNAIVDILIGSEEGTIRHKLGRYLKNFQRLSFASLLFGDGNEKESLNMDYAINVLQIQNLKLPNKSKKPESYDVVEQLSMAMMLAIGQFSTDFIKSDRTKVKFVGIDESWIMEKTEIGMEIIEQLLKEGRAMNSGTIRATQVASDIDGATKALVGCRFIFQNSDAAEVRASLKLLNIDDPDDSLIDMIQNFRPGQCLFQDIYGRIGVVQLSVWFKDIEKAFNTTPGMEQPKEEEQKIEPLKLVHS